MTTDDDVFLREVDEDLQQDRQLAALRRYGPYLAGLAILVLIGIGVHQVLEGRRHETRAEAASAYTAALEAGEPDALREVAARAPDGYAALARMAAAGALARSGDRQAALGAYAEVYDDELASPPLADLARVRAGYLALEDGGTAADTLVANVTTERLLPFAREVTALSAMARGDFASAETSLEALAAAPETPAGLRNRANLLAALADAGAQGVPLEAQGSQSEDFIETFGRQLRESGAIPGARPAPVPATQGEATTEAAPDQNEGAE
ncbi:hypothetical protein [Parvularcula dongshanensis]|uniref:Tetratricopeptide repeat-like domain-containing protein n=1 Tax=Parvularcula dongshanensis TaxID=1173995 RepID=A0A840I1Z6_9PROT|nr:hypothetical protein [Parvularcula dongshanensis]MBB4659036.1 hypothetical protein [Parvularcula dongshanensis]